MSIKELSEGKKNARDFTPEELKAASGGSVRHHKDGFEVFNSRSGESHGVFADYYEAVRVAKKHKISGLNTSGEEWNFVREREDYKHSSNPYFGTGSFN